MGIKYDVFLDSGVSVEVDEDPDGDATGTPYEAGENVEAYLTLRRKAREQLIAMLESDRFDLSYDRQKEG